MIDETRRRTQRSENAYVQALNLKRRQEESRLSVTQLMDGTWQLRYVLQFAFVATDNSDVHFMTRLPQLHDAISDAAQAMEPDGFARSVRKLIGILPDVLRDRSDFRDMAVLAGMTLRLNKVQPLALVKFLLDRQRSSWPESKIVVSDADAGSTCSDERGLNLNRIFDGSCVFLEEHRGVTTTITSCAHTRGRPVDIFLPVAHAISSIF